MAHVPVDDVLPDAEAHLDEVRKLLIGLEEQSLLIANARKLGDV
jgi:hypothetical protein